jgi:hypothetical protein
LRSPFRAYLGVMSNNYKLYTQKVAEMRATRRSTPHPLRAQLDELLAVVQRCEHLWKIEERIENSLG